MESLRILQFVPYFPPYPGGQERIILNLCKYLVSFGHSVSVVTSNYPKTATREIVDGIAVLRRDVFFRPLRNPIAPGFLLAPAHFSDYDVVHIHNEHSFPSSLAAVHRARVRFPLVLTNHGQLVFDNALDDRFERLYMTTIGRFVLGMSDAIVANSLSDLDFLAAILPEVRAKSETIPSAIDIPYLERIYSTQVVEGSPFVEADLRILYVGQLIRRKGLEWLIRALAILRKSFKSRMMCILVGEGNDRGRLESLVSELGLGDSVRFTGRLSDKELFLHYRTANVFVLPSLSEGCPVSILEAMFFGVPVVATDIPGTRDNFHEYATLVPPRNDAELATAIEHICSDSVTASDRSRKCRSLVTERNSFQRFARDYERLYFRLMQDPQSQL